VLRSAETHDGDCRMWISFVKKWVFDGDVAARILFGHFREKGAFAR
jgi:hypothetical protein